MTTFTTFFVGGTWDGRWGRTYGSRFHIVPKPCPPRRLWEEPIGPEYIDQRYRRRFVVRDPDIRDDLGHPDGGFSHFVYVLEDA